MTLVVEETKSEKEFSLDTKSIIEFVDIMHEEIPHGFPPMRGIQHQIDLIPGLVFPNKLASMNSPKEHEEFKTQVDDFLDKGLFKRVKVPMWFPLCWCMKKRDLGVCVLIAKLSTKF